MDKSTLPNIVYGGTSADTSLVTGSSLPNPMAAYLRYGGLHLWAKQFNSAYDSVTAIKFNPSATKVVLIFGQSPFTVVLLDATSGAVISSYKDPSSGYGIVVNDGLLIDSSDTVIISLTSNDQNWQII